MIHGSVTLDEVFSAAWARAASLVPETSGYLALAVGDATSRLPFAVDGRLVMLTTEGSVSITKRGEMLTPAQAAKGLRAILARLLSVATGTAMPSLSAAARPREESDRGVDAVIEEIEAALIPVNRSAARRALARLVRETIKARESGKLKKPSTRPPPEAPKPAVAAIAPRPRVPAAPPVPVVAAAPAVAVVAAAPVVAMPVERPAVSAPPSALAAPALVTVPVLTPAPEPVVVALPVTVVEAPEPIVVAAPAVAVATPEPVVVAPAAAPVVATPEPVVAMATAPLREEEPGELLEEIPLFIEPHRDPTPTWLGMAAVELEPEPHPSLDVSTEALASEPYTEAPEVARAAAADSVAFDVVEIDVDPEPTALPESTVLGQPTEDPALAFEMVRRVERPMEALTPPFPFEIAPPPRGLPAARVAAVAPPPPVESRSEPPPAVEVRPEPPPPAAACEPPRPRDLKPTRADDLLAHFGASCVDDDGMREAAACLRRIAGLDATPPPARVEVRVVAAPPPAPPLAALPADWETPPAPRAKRRQGRSGAALSLTLAALVAGAVGAGAVVRLRPDLVASVVRAATPARAVAPAVVVREVAPPAAPPAPTAEPASVIAPGYGERLGGTRAERGTGQRAR